MIGVRDSAIPTPCAGLCKLDAETGLCLGCARTAEEVGQWQHAPEDLKRAIWERLPPRRGALGMSSWRLPWAFAEVSRFMEMSLRERLGTWTLGEAALHAGFSSEGNVEVYTEDGAVIAIKADRAIRLRPHEKIAAFLFPQGGDPQRPAIGLALPAGRARFPAADASAWPCADSDAIREGDRSEFVSDADFNRPGVRVLRRSDETQIVETALGRIELAGNPANTLAANNGNETAPEGWPLLPIFLPCAWFTPAPHALPLFAGGALG